MSQFTRPLVVVPLDDGKSWVVVCDDFQYVSEDGSVTLKVPQWMVTDFASTPTLLWSVMGGAWGKHGNAAVIHDFGYWDQSLPRKVYDDLFLEGMRVLGVSRVRSRLMWAAVRSFGYFAWRANAGRNERHGANWRLHTLARIPDLPVLRVTEELRKYAETPMRGWPPWTGEQDPGQPGTTT